MSPKRRSYYEATTPSKSRFSYEATRLAVFLLSSVGVTPLSVQASARIVPRLGLVPRTCSVGPAPTVLGPVFGVGSAVSGYGAFPVWGMAFDGAHATLRWSPDPHNPNTGFMPLYGWGHKMLWVMKPGFRGRVTLYGGDLRGGSPVWFNLDGPGQRPTTSLVLDPRHLPATPSGRGKPWPQFPGGMFVPHAGCYYIDARWPGGHWRMTFAAGRAR